MLPNWEAFLLYEKLPDLDLAVSLRFGKSKVKIGEHLPVGVAHIRLSCT
jgi:hypothetical protein